MRSIQKGFVKRNRKSFYRILKNPISAQIAHKIHTTVEKLHHLIQSKIKRHNGKNEPKIHVNTDTHNQREREKHSLGPILLELHNLCLFHGPYHLYVEKSAFRIYCWFQCVFLLLSD